MTETKTLEELTDALERTERALELIIKERTQELAKNGSSWTKHVGTIITIATLALGGVGAWYTNQASVSELHSNQDRLENKVLRLENTTHDIELRVVQETTDLGSLKESTQEIKQDVKEIKQKIFSGR